MVKLTYITNHDDWEAIYIDGEKVEEQHLHRLWPRQALNIMEQYDIDETERREVGYDFEWPKYLSEEE